MNNDDENLDAKFKRIAINFDDSDETSSEVEPEVTPDDRPEEPSLRLGLEPELVEGPRLRFEFNLDPEAIDEYLLVQPPDEKQYLAVLPWINILSLVGARTFTDPDLRVQFVDPMGSWVDFYFQEIPKALSDLEYGQLIWTKYVSIDLWLKDAVTGEYVKQLRLVQPEPEEPGPEFDDGET